MLLAPRCGEYVGTGFQVLRSIQCERRWDSVLIRVLHTRAWSFDYHFSVPRGHICCVSSVESYINDVSRLSSLQQFSMLDMRDEALLRTTLTPFRGS